MEGPLEVAQSSKPGSHGPREAAAPSASRETIQPRRR
jgi:hypothetical protein